MSTDVAGKLSTKSAPKVVKQVRLKLVYIDIWSATKAAFVLSLCIATSILVAVFLIYTIVIQAGLLNNLNVLLKDLVSGNDFDLYKVISLPKVMGIAIVAAVVNTIVGTLLGSLCAAMYNLLVKIVGGIQLGFTSN